MRHSNANWSPANQKLLNIIIKQHKCDEEIIYKIPNALLGIDKEIGEQQIRDKLIYWWLQNTCALGLNINLRILALAPQFA